MNNKRIRQIHFIILTNLLFLSGFILGSGNFHPIIFNIAYWLFILLACLSAIFIILTDKKFKKEV